MRISDWSSDVGSSDLNSIGRAYAIGLANAGASVVVADLNREGAERVAGEIEEAGGKAIAVQVDIADEASVSAMMETAEAAFGGLDILVNNAALMVEAVGTPAIQTSIADFARMMRINLHGALIRSSSEARPSWNEDGW